MDIELSLGVKVKYTQLQQDLIGSYGGSGLSYSRWLVRLRMKNGNPLPFNAASVGLCSAHMLVDVCCSSSNVMSLSLLYCDLGHRLFIARSITWSRVD